jgi:ATP-dependent helicase Lhr and Lhr-like helicase
MTDPFRRLAPFIQEYIYAHSWTELRDVQVEASRVIFDTDAHLLLASATASGKTEAAFLPILTLLQEEPSDSVGVLYIGPLKALINDQFVRLNDLLKEVRIPVWHWHGDVSQSEKSKLLKDPRGVLQITPESIESLLINRTTQLGRLFRDLRFVVIDEVHVFMNSDRGRQIICQLARLSKYTNSSPRRVGLSATLGDYRSAETWLRAGTDREVITPQVGSGKRKVLLAVQHFEEASQTKEGHSYAPSQASIAPDDYFRYIYDLSKGKKCLIFANSRSETEAVTANLRHLAEREGTPDVYHVHHGSIAAPLREAAEVAMREPERPAVIAATVSLELGIDIGQLERVLQLQAPYSVASFLQRLGRSGRRGQAAEMIILSRESARTGKENWPQQIPWSLLQAIAVIQLYVEEKWIEPATVVRYPFSLLYQQTMSTLAACGELSPAALAERVLTLPPFQFVSPEDFRLLLLHLLELDHIQRTDEGGLIVGLAGERVVRNFRFYATFAESTEFTVFEDSRAIGTITWAPPPGERFGLAGRTWEVVEVDPKRMTVLAKRVSGKVEAHWSGGGGTIHTRILQRIRQVLQESTEYAYLQPAARERLRKAREMAHSTHIADSLIIPLEDNTSCIFPWMGTIACSTLMRTLTTLGADEFGQLGGSPPYYVIVHAGASCVRDALSRMAEQSLEPAALLHDDEAPQFEKYDEFVPDVLLRKACGTDRLDVKEMQQCLRATMKATGTL